MNQALYQAATLTFEELGFMFPIEAADPAGIAAKTCATVSVSFAGEFRGELILKVEKSVLPLMAANMLGEDTPPDEAMQMDALGEIANVICGNTLPMIGGKKSVFRLSAPKPVETTDQYGDANAKALFDLDEGKAEVLLYLNRDRK